MSRNRKGPRPPQEACNARAVGVGRTWPEIQQLIDALPFYVLLIDAEHTVLMANEVTRNDLGVSVEQLVGHFCPRAIHGLDGPFPGCPLAQAVATQGYVESEVQDEERGTWYVSSVAPTALHTAGGARVYAHFVRDITAQKQASDGLQRSLEHARALSELLQRVQRCTTCVEVLEEVTEQVLSLSWMGLRSTAAGFLVEGEQLRLVTQRNLPTSQVERCTQVPLGQCFCGEAALQGEVCVRLDDSEEHTQRSAGGTPHGHVLIPVRYEERTVALLTFYLPPGEALDATRLDFLTTVANLASVTFNQLWMQAQLVQTDRLASMGVLAGIVSHEIRTPLNVLSLNLQMVARSLQGEGELSRQQLQQRVALMEAEIARIDRYIEAPLNVLGRHQAAEIRRLNLNDEVISAMEFLEPEARRREVRLARQLARRLPQVEADVVKLRRILLELVLVGLKSNDATAVFLTTRKAGALVEVAVRYKGVDPRWLALTSEELAPVANVGPEGIQHDGIGLIVCARLAGAMQGTIRAEPGDEMTLVLALPATP